MPLTSNGVRQHGNEETSLTDSAGDSALPRPSIVPDCSTAVNLVNDAQAEHTVDVIYDNGAPIAGE